MNFIRSVVYRILARQAIIRGKISNIIRKRQFSIKYHEGADVTAFELKEPRLGKKNIFGWEA